MQIYANEQYANELICINTTRKRCGFSNAEKLAIIYSNRLTMNKIIAKTVFQHEPKLGVGGRIRIDNGG